MRIRGATILCTGLSLLSVLVSAEASGTPFKIDVNDEYCRQPQVRTTVIYIDTMMMFEGRLAFYQTLKDRLKGSLAPGERVSVVSLDTAEGSTELVWSSCWQEWSAGNLEEQKQKAGWFSRDPERAQGPDQEKFWAEFDELAVGKIYLSHKRPSTEALATVDKAPPKELVRALASDAARFPNSPVTVRAIVYSDMAEKSNLGSAFKELPPQPPNFGEKTGGFFPKGVFYFFGVGDDIQNRGDFLDTSHAFWLRVIKSMHGVVGGYGTDLTVIGAKPVRRENYDVAVTRDAEELDGRVSLLTDGDGDLLDSWIGLAGLGSAALSGSYKCGGQTCRLDANTSIGLTTTAPSEGIALSGAPASLSGNVGIKGTPQWWGTKAIKTDQ